MKNLLFQKWFIVLLFLTQFLTFAQDNKIKIYESKLGNGTCIIVFPDSPQPLMVMVGNGECTVVKTMAMDDWNQMSSSTVVTTSVSDLVTEEHSVKSPRDAASGLATGKRQHKPYLLSDLSLNTFAGDNPQVCSFSWNIKNNTGVRSASGKVALATGGCCSNGVCTVTVAMSKTHTKSGHVTLMK
ncbi:MAG: hypothetical protein ABI426_02090 [Flavobacterium sp.]